MLRLKASAKSMKDTRCKVQAFELDTDYVVSAVGRIPNVESLHLENAGVDYSKRRIKVNDYLQTSNPRVLPVEMYWIRNNLN